MNYFSQWETFKTDVSTWQNHLTEEQRTPRKRLAQHVNEHCNTVLNVGCGIAANTEYYTSEYIGVDVTPKFTKEAHKKGTQILNASGLNLPFKDGSFDGVVSENVLMHMPPTAWKTFLNELCRVASKTVALLGNRWDWRQDAKTKFKIGEVYGQTRFYLNRYSAEDIREVFESKGMTGSAIISKTEDWQLTIYQK